MPIPEPLTRLGARSQAQVRLGCVREFRVAEIALERDCGPLRKSYDFRNHHHLTFGSITFPNSTAFVSTRAVASQCPRKSGVSAKRMTCPRPTGSRSHHAV